MESPVLQVELEESAHATLDRCRDARRAYTTRAYAPKQKEFKVWCDRNGFHETTRYQVTAAEMHLLLQEEVVDRKVRTKGSDRKISPATVEIWALFATRTYQEPTHTYVGDSAIVIGMTTMMRVRAVNLIPIIREIRRIINRLRRVHIPSVPRMFNVTADALYNWIMEQGSVFARHTTAADTVCPLPEPQWAGPYSRLRTQSSRSSAEVDPHWHHSEARIGVWPVPHSYPSATAGANSVTHRLLKDYYAGRCTLVTVAALTSEPGFHLSAFTLVPKKDVPISEDGRIINDLSTELKAELLWWKELVFESQFTGVPMIMLDSELQELDRWVVITHNNHVTVYGLTPGRVQHVTFEEPVFEILQFVEHWIAVTPPETGNAATPEELSPRSGGKKAHALSELGLADRLRQIAEFTTKLKRASISSEFPRTYEKRFRPWEAYCNEFRFPIWIDTLSQERRAGIVGLFAGLCALEIHNSRKQGNNYHTSPLPTKCAQPTHKYKTSEFELIARGFKGANSSVEWKQLVTASLLLEVHRQLQDQRSHTNTRENVLLWGCIVIGFFFLDRRLG
ncbi:hypothetical protein ON010_g15338 [Phytophthora cinnamomi]|nr:hypothetical protein ON010_g15338 [Phytophthora cinnamomi]